MTAEVNKPVNADAICAKVDPAEVKRRWHALLDEMKATPKPDYIEKREPIIWRDA